MLHQYVSYNAWANARLADVLRTLTPAQLDQEIVSSFPSIRKTVFHISDAEQVWLSRLHGFSPTEWPSKNADSGTAIDGWMNASKTLLEFVEKQPAEFFQSSNTYRTMAGMERTTKVEGMIMHCMNHSTHHRGQLVTMLRQAGVKEIPSLDLITYLWQ